MGAIHSKSTFVYARVRRALQSGHYAPGQRLDPATLAAELNTSTTPVRLALNRLLGERLITDHARDGLHVPLLNEIAMRELYDWMEYLLLTACDNSAAPVARKAKPLELASADDDLIKLTWQLFDNIARATACCCLHQSVRVANDQLAPIRRAAHRLIEHTYEELSELNRLWQARDIPALKFALSNYHQRRKQLVPCVVAILNGRGSFPQ